MYYKDYTDNLKEYDLKRQMWENTGLEKSKNCIVDVADYCGISESQLNEIFNSNDCYAIERYLLYRAELTLCYDCDKSKIVRDFYKIETRGTVTGYDSLFSFQYIWGKAVRSVIKVPELPSEDWKYYESKYGYNAIKRTAVFISQLKHLDRIKEKLREQDKDLPEEKQLLPALEKLAHYYHTIGNMTPCCKGKYNLVKGDYKNGFYDRLDLFYKWLKNPIRELNTLSGKVSEAEKNEMVKWFSEENIEKYKLSKIIDCQLPDSIPDHPSEMAIYTKNIIKLICIRSDELLVHTV